MRMFHFFRRQHKRVGVDITSHSIRFVEITSMHGTEHVSSYGEVLLDDACIVDGVIKDEDTLILHLKEVQRVIGSARVLVSLPENAFARRFEDVLAKAGMQPERFVSTKDALISSVIPKGSTTSFLVMQAEYDTVNFLTFLPGETGYYIGDPTNHSVVININRLYVDWYDRYQERVAHTVVVGSRATDHTFLDFVGRETKLSFTPAHVLVNLYHEHEQVPMITKEDTYKYAVAIGAALM